VKLIQGLLQCVLFDEFTIVKALLGGFLKFSSISTNIYIAMLATTISTLYKTILFWL
jgi:hypothetical protein